LKNPILSLDNLSSISKFLALRKELNSFFF